MSVIVESATRDSNGISGQGANPASLFGRKRCLPDRGSLQKVSVEGRLGSLKLLLVGPFPPPHGGISVHVQNAATLLERNIAKVKILNVEPRAPQSNSYIKVSNALDLAAALMTHAWDGW